MDPRAQLQLLRSKQSAEKKKDSDPLAYRRKNAISSSKDEQQAKVMAGRYASGDEAKKRIETAAKRRALKQGKYATRKAEKNTTGAKRLTPFDGVAKTTAYNKVKEAAMKESPDRPTGTAAQRRKWRITNGDFKGKYYGPDVFKGDLKKIKEWKAKGKPVIKGNGKAGTGWPITVADSKFRG